MSTVDLQHFLVIDKCSVLYCLYGWVCLHDLGRALGN